MSRPFPYTYISCPCADTPVPDPARKRRSRESPQKPRPEDSSAGANDTGKDREDKRDTAEELEEVDEEEERTFDPRSPRSNFSLYPPEQLLYCEDCHQIKCPRCITEEIVCWYCPHCLFETPSSMVRSEGNRCARNCFTCPVCVGPLTTSTLESVAGNDSQQGPWVLSCGYCMWTTLDIGIKFDKPTNIRNQLSKMTDSGARGIQMSRSLADLKSPLSNYASIDDQFTASEDGGGTPTEEQPQRPPSSGPLGSDARFAALKGFYRNQITETATSPTDPLGADFGGGFSSPGALNRIMSLYTSSSRLGGFYGGANKKPKSKPPVMREALTNDEGFKSPAAGAEDAVIRRMASEECGWDGVASMEQRAFQSPDSRFVEELLPLPTLLRTKRSKRCKSCKHILVKPEFKPQSIRFRIRLIALSYIPLATLRPLTLGPSQPGGTLASNLDALPPLKPIQFLLTLKNHMFDPVRVTLATPSITPGRVGTKVTILCPQFEIDANNDVWDEALQAPNDHRSSRSGPMGAGHEKAAEAGKVWEKGRNWTTVVIEMAPGTLPGSTSASKKPQQQQQRQANDNDDDDDDFDENTNFDWSGQSKDPNEQLQPDEDVLEIPIFVRMEWDSENQIEQSVRGQNSDTVKRELAYWMVLGVGRIAPLA